MSDWSYVQKYFYFLQLKKGNPGRGREKRLIFPAWVANRNTHIASSDLLFESSQMTNLLFKSVCWLNKQGINTY